MYYRVQFGLETPGQGQQCHDSHPYPLARQVDGSLAVTMAVMAVKCHAPDLSRRLVLHVQHDRVDLDLVQVADRTRPHVQQAVAVLCHHKTSTLITTPIQYTLVITNFMVHPKQSL